MAKPRRAQPMPDEHNTAVAIGLILLAVTLFSCLDATAKYLVLNSGLPTGQITWIRFAAQFLAMALVVPALGIMKPRAMFKTNALKLQIARSIFMALTTIFNFLALKYLQLDQSISILFLAPLAVALLAGPVLGEWVGWRRVVAILIGFAGVLIVIRPGVGAFNIGMLFSLAAMSALVVFILLTRKLAGRDPAIVTLFYSMFAGVLFGAPYAWMYGLWPKDVTTWAMMLALGVFGGLGHYLFILAYNRTPASYLSPFLYMQIIPMTLLGYVVFENLPDAFTVTGALIIVMSGLYIYHRERMTRTR